jgi:hypothetical protein
MHKAQDAGASFDEGRLPLSMAAELMADRPTAESVSVSHQRGLPARMYALMVAVALLTFAILVAGYEMLPPDQTFA